MQRIKILSEKKGAPVALRVEVQASGCKGFQYKFSIADKIEENDM
jgi:iron-sulfur cluster insertion protein